MSEEETRKLKLECIKIAAANPLVNSMEEVISKAGKLFDFITSKDK